MKKQASYTITLDFSSSDQKLLAQIQRESNGAMHSLEAVVYRLAVDGINAKLQAQHDANVARYNARKKSKTSDTDVEPEPAVAE